MNKEQLAKDIEAMKERLASMEKELKKKELEKKEIKMFPQKGDEYWYFVDKAIHKDTMYFDQTRVNVYKTREEAEIARDIAFAKTRLKHAVEVANKNWKPDWNANDFKHYFRYESARQEVKIDCWSRRKHQPNWMYMKSREVAEEILANHREDIELILGE